MITAYYYISMVGAVLLAVIFQEYLIVLLIIAAAIPVVGYYHKRGWKKNIYTVILYNKDMNEVARFENIKAWEPQDAYYSIRGKKRHLFWDTEQVGLEKEKKKTTLRQKPGVSVDK